MKRWLARLFGAPLHDAASQTDPGAALAVPVTALADSTPAPDAQPDLDLAFFHWLAGPHVSGLPAADNLVLDELARLARDPQDAAARVPRVPAVIPQLLRSLRDEGASAGALARQVAQDPLLVAQVIREVNSSYYQPASPVRNLEGALLLLGQNGLRMLLARVAFRPIISQQTGRLARLVAPQLWRQSEHCARGASLLAPGHGADPFEAYLAGLMHNVGLVVAFRVIDGLVAHGGLPDDDAFGTRLVQAARLLSGRIAGEWDLPPAIGHAIVHLGDAGALPAVLAEADRLAKLRMLARGGQPGFVRAVAQLAPAARDAYDRLDDDADDQDT